MDDPNTLKPLPPSKTNCEPFFVTAPAPGTLGGTDNRVLVFVSASDRTIVTVVGETWQPGDQQVLGRVLANGALHF
jgi:hypothetical protein